MNRLDIATLPGGRAVNYDWTVDGLLSKVTYGNGMQRVYGYDDADRVTSILNTLGATDTEEFNYSYDANSNREAETRKFNGQTARSLNYQYDALNRLTQANYGANALVNWGYDKVGNRLSESGTEVGGAAINRTFTHDEGNRLRSITDSTDASKSLTLDYDLSGNLTKEHKPNGDERRFEYDAFNQMLRASSFAASVGTETELGSYDYDFEGRRIARTAGASTLQYVYSGINVVNEYNGTAGQLVNSYDYGADLVRGDLAGEGERLYFHDALGSTTALSSGSGATVARYEYDAWGKQITAVQPSSNRVNFTGYRHDDETSFEYAMARYYDSGKGRFTSIDPITENEDRLKMPQGTNFFTYVTANPLKFVDPDGRDWWRNKQFPHTILWLNEKPGESWDKISPGYYPLTVDSNGYPAGTQFYLSPEGKVTWPKDSGPSPELTATNKGLISPKTGLEGDLESNSGWGGAFKGSIYDTFRYSTFQFNREDVQRAKFYLYYLEGLPGGAWTGIKGVAEFGLLYAVDRPQAEFEMSKMLYETGDFWAQSAKNPDQLHQGITGAAIDLGPRKTFNSIGDSAGQVAGPELLFLTVPKVPGALRSFGESPRPFSRVNLLESQSIQPKPQGVRFGAPRGGGGSAADLAYARQITGGAERATYLNGTEFEGIRGGVLLDAKNASPTASFYDISGVDSFTLKVKIPRILEQAERQISAARGQTLVKRIEWHVADAEVALQLKTLFKLRGIDIRVLFTPWR